MEPIGTAETSGIMEKSVDSLESVGLKVSELSIGVSRPEKGASGRYGKLNSLLLSCKLVLGPRSKAEASGCGGEVACRPPKPARNLGCNRTPLRP